MLSVRGYEDVVLTVAGPMACGLERDNENIVTKAAHALMMRRGTGFLDRGAWLTLEKNLPVASGMGGGSADAAAALRLLTRFWGLDPRYAQEIAPELGSDVPACLLSMTARGVGAGDELELLEDSAIAGSPVLLVNPRIPLSTADVFARWDGTDRGPLGDWREGRNDLEAPATELVPQVGELLDWLRSCNGATFVRMSGSGPTCFALFENEGARDAAAAAVPERWWHLATHLR